MPFRFGLPVGTKKETTMIRLTLSIALLLLFSVPASAQDKPTEEAPKLETLAQRAGYAIGQNIGNSLKQTGVEIDLKTFLRGMQDALAGKKLLLSDEDIEKVMMEFGRQEQANRAAQQKLMAEKNTKEGAAFLAANGKKDGVKTTQSGLQYKVTKRGSGLTPKAASRVRVHYEGRLISGKVFDSSFKRGEPAEFPVNGVIKGWTEALQLMKEGDEWELYIPSTLGYGTRGTGADIGPNATLIFKVQLIKVLQ
jgi:FKBP-type peptidyl-prolyl cis-trans isomerase